MPGIRGTLLHAHCGKRQNIIMGLAKGKSSRLANQNQGVTCLAVCASSLRRKIAFILDGHFSLHFLDYIIDLK